MTTVSMANCSWMSNALQFSKEQTFHCLEEMSMHVAKDLDWIQGYKAEVIASLLSHDMTETELLSAEGIGEAHEFSSVVIGSKDDSDTVNSTHELAQHVHGSATSIIKTPTTQDESTAPISTTESSETSNSPIQRLSVQTAHYERPVTDTQPQLEPLILGHTRNVLKSPDELNKVPRLLCLEDGNKEVVETSMIPLKIVGNRRSTHDDQIEMDIFTPVEIEKLNEPTQHKDTRLTADNQEIDTDYLQPINLNSPEKTAHRNDSAYFSAAESPSTTSAAQSSPRKSIAFASLPPRQPFSKKSLGPRSSQSHASVFDGPRSSQKIFAGELSEKSIVKIEPLSTPHMTNRVKANLPKQALQVEKEQQTVESTQEGHLSETSKESVAKDIQNPFETVSIETASQPQVTAVSTTEDEDWLPRFETSVPSPRKPKESFQATELPTLLHDGQPMQPGNPTRPESIMSQLNKVDQATPGPIKAAMQAASAKATSYLRQARTAFGSPSINHTKVFRSTTPMQSPPKPRLKTEPQTPKLYPTLDASIQPSQKPSMIPSKTPSKSPDKHKLLAESPRRSPRRSPKKGTEAIQSMAVIAARNASAKATTEALVESHVKKTNNEQLRIESPARNSRLATKPVMHVKAKPLSIRVATASQREIDNTKDRKVQPSSTRALENSAASILSRTTMENGQLEYLSKSQQGNQKRPAPSRQIKALAAANQAKEKAEKEQERREQQKRELEKKRHENSKRLMHEEEKRKTDMIEDLNKKRKAAEARVISAKKLVVRQASTNGHTREIQMRDHETTSMKDNRQSVKRALNEADDNVINTGLQDTKRQRISEQSDSISAVPHAGSTIISKPVRVSLQKKSLFGHPGEPGYKKPGTTTMAKPGPVVDTVKFSTEPIRFAVTSTSTTTASTIQEPAKLHNLPPSELIELPEINSDYSDSDDDEPAQKDAFERPNWAETPELRKLLRKQQRIDPDDVFGPIPPLQMEEIFKGKERALARFRPRSSSANWSGNDKLSAEEVTDYARAMGYKN